MAKKTTKKVTSAVLKKNAAPSAPARRRRSRPEPADTRSLNPTAENVAVRAYYLFLERGLDGGNEIEDWLRADRELTA